MCDALRLYSRTAQSTSAGLVKPYLPTLELGIVRVLRSWRQRRPTMLLAAELLLLLLLLLAESAEAGRAHELDTQRLDGLLRQLERHPIRLQRPAGRLDIKALVATPACEVYHQRRQVGWGPQ